MDAWIFITLFAALAQPFRFVLQKRLRGGTLSTACATLSWFFYSGPLVAVIVTVYMAARGFSVPAMFAAFWTNALAGGLAQILATMGVVALVGITSMRGH